MQYPESNAEFYSIEEYPKIASPRSQMSYTKIDLRPEIKAS
jgi:hypothetical protein